MIASDEDCDPNIAGQHEDRSGPNPPANLSRFVQESTQDAGEEAEFFELPIGKILQHSLA